MAPALNMPCCAWRLNNESSSRHNWRCGTFVIMCSCLLAMLVAPNRAQGDDGLCSNTPSDCLLGSTTFNEATNCCEPCTACDKSRMSVLSRCNVTHDAICRCEPPTYLDDTSHVCALECAMCPGTGKCKVTAPECLCSMPECHLSGDVYCSNPFCGDIVAMVTTRGTGGPSVGGGDRDTFPAWGIGLIAVGIVIGIIIFASCFLFMGIFSMHRNTEPESHRGSESSENGLVGRDSFSSMGTKTSYVSSSSLMYPYLSTHSVLELLKNSNPQLLTSKDKLSSLQGSPVSARASPKPDVVGRTVRLAKNSSTDKVTAIVL